MPVWDIFRKKKKEDGYEDFNDFQVKERRRWTDEALHEDVKYALQVGKAFIGWLPQGSSALREKIVLEIGPGLNFGSTLYLTCFGARALVVDPYLAAWDDEYHPRFYALLRDAILKEAPEQDITPFNGILAYGGYDPDILKPVLASLEELEAIASSSVDYVFSNAVLEHIYDPQRAFKSLARITRPGGMGFHQVDFRDHRNMDTPLEFLLLADADFIKLAEECHYECGNRWRPYEYEELFRRVGFEIVAPPWGLQVDGNYHKSFIPRLRAAQGSKYQHCSEEYLHLIGGFFKVRKPKGEK